jgi:serine/threonine protein kinase/class 3 adenylate cyclase/Flp pilus assembly protein TadD
MVVEVFPIMTRPAHSEECTDSGAMSTPAPGDFSFVAPVSPLATPELSGTVGRYRILRKLGRGGMGTVYLAHDNDLDRPVALKVPQFEAGDQTMLRERFYREARAAANLQHPNICPVHDIGFIGEVPFLTMAYIEGQSLSEWMAGTHPVGERVRLVRKIALALHEAHRVGVVHRDLKPSNVLVDSRGEPIVLDFGLARRIQVEEKDRLTSPGLIVGTPGYMAPEQALALAEASGPVCDVYSLGVILYELLCGRLPFVGGSILVLTQVIRDTPQPPSALRPELGDRYDTVCLRALAREPGDRFRSMGELATALETLCEGITPILPVTPLPMPATLALPETEMLSQTLELLRRWGWSRAMQRLRGRVQKSTDEHQRERYDTLLNWLAGTEEPTTEAQRTLFGWALAGRASRLLRERQFAEAQRLLDRAEAEGDPEDALLTATIAHTRGTAWVHQGRCDEALPYLHRALEIFTREHFMTGRVLDTLGTAYAAKGNFPIAREFYEQSLRFKQRFEDESGIAVSHGQLGRLYLDWGQLDEAEDHFRQDLELAQRLRSRFSEAQIYNHLGQVALARGEIEAAAGRRAAMRRHYGTAAGWLTRSIEFAVGSKHIVAEGFARKDMAMLALLEGDLDRAGEQASAARSLFLSAGFDEGIAKVGLVMGMILRERGHFAEAEQRLRESQEFFERTNENDDAVRAIWELARVQRDRRAPLSLVGQAYEQALERAECLRHDPLVKAIEREFHDCDAEGYLRHMYHRTRGLSIDHDDPTLMEGCTESASVLFVDLPGFTEFAQGMGPQAVLVTFNHLLADFAEVLDRYRGRVIAYRGNGLMGLTRDERHAERAVLAALDLQAALEAFNRPRQVLGLPTFQMRMGIASGEVLLGNVGTYHKMDFTAIGAAVSIAGAIRNEARNGLPCISRATYESVRSRFTYESNTPRGVSVTGYGLIDVWDVRGSR